MKARITLILLFNMLACGGFAQSLMKAGQLRYERAWGEPDSSQVYKYPVDTLYFGWQTGNCKGTRLVPLYLYAEREDTLTGVRIRSANNGYQLPARKPVPFLTVHGHVTYDYYYQSHADTPYLEREIHQHTLQTSLDITIRNQYPVRVAFSTSRSNASLLRSITGLNLQYANRDFKHSLLAKAQAWDAGKVRQWQEIQQLKNRLDKSWDSLYRMKSLLNAPDQIQKMVEARERELYGKVKEKLPEFDGKLRLPLKGFRNKISQLKPHVGDSLLNGLQQEYSRNAAKIDSVRKSIAETEAAYEKKLSAYGLKKETLVALLTEKMNPKQLIDRLEDMNIPDSVLPKGYKTLLSLRTVGIGRTMVDYSELTARNISIIGVQAELNPSWYVAVASGMVDYRFRDFIVNTNRQRQYLNMIRVGTGMRDGSNVILTYYAGKKQAYNFGSSVPVAEPDNRIMGFSLEGRWQLDRHTFVIGEVAKSSMPSHARVIPKDGLGGSMMRFSDRSNEAYALSAVTTITKTGTRLNGMYKMMGENFQSFSLYASGSRQNGWLLKADQPFFKQQLTISASLRKNAYNSVFESSSYMSSTVFKSIQATFRKRNWPMVSLGYFPSSQLMKLGEDRFMENMFYTMSGTVSHYYKVRETGMNTMFSGTRFYNRQADSNFVYFNSTNLQLNQAFFIGKLTLNGIVSSATNQDYALFGGEGNVQYRIRTWLDAGGGLKYSYQTVYSLRQVGYAANVRVDIPRIGELLLMIDQGFVPGADKKLVPNKTGRLTYTRVF